jgi:outer membrane protein assembly factor BamA
MMGATSIASLLSLTLGAVQAAPKFIGNATTRDTIVRRRVLQQEGEPYNQELMEKSVARLNDLGRFEILTMADIEMRVDEKEHFVDLVVHLKEINRSQTRR